MRGPVCTTVASFQPFARWTNIHLALFCARHCLWLWLPPWKTQVLGSWLGGWAPRPAVGEAWCLEEASWRQFAVGNCPVKLGIQESLAENLGTRRQERNWGGIVCVSEQFQDGELKAEPGETSGSERYNLNRAGFLFLDREGHFRPVKIGNHGIQAWVLPQTLQHVI